MKSVKLLTFENLAGLQLSVSTMDRTKWRFTEAGILLLLVRLELRTLEWEFCLRHHQSLDCPRSRTRKRENRYVRYSSCLAACSYQFYLRRRLLAWARFDEHGK